MPYTVWGRRPKQRKKDYSYVQISNHRTKNKAIKDAQRYQEIGYHAVHVRHDKVIGFVKDDNTFYQPPKKGRKK